LPVDRQSAIGGTIRRVVVIEAPDRRLRDPVHLIATEPLSASSRPAAASTDADVELARLAKALGHPTRVRILRLVAERTTCPTGELAAELPFAQSTVSEHLRILRDAGLIRTEDAQGRPCYCANPDALDTIKAHIAAL
jgi:ArsR family transcriptional regulator